MLNFTTGSRTQNMSLSCNNPDMHLNILEWSCRQKNYFQVLHTACLQNFEYRQQSLFIALAYEEAATVVVNTCSTLLNTALLMISVIFYRIIYNNRKKGFLLHLNDPIPQAHNHQNFNTTPNYQLEQKLNTHRHKMHVYIFKLYILFIWDKINTTV